MTSKLQVTLPKALAQKYGVEMPICSAVDDIIAGRTSIDEAIFALLARPFRAEKA